MPKTDVINKDVINKSGDGIAMAVFGGSFKKSCFKKSCCSTGLISRIRGLKFKIKNQV